MSINILLNILLKKHLTAYHLFSLEERPCYTAVRGSVGGGHRGLDRNPTTVCVRVSRTDHEYGENHKMRIFMMCSHKKNIGNTLTGQGETKIKR